MLNKGILGIVFIVLFLVHSGCNNKILQTGKLTNNRYFSQVLRSNIRVPEWSGEGSLPGKNFHFIFTWQKGHTSILSLFKKALSLLIKALPL